MQHYGVHLTRHILPLLYVQHLLRLAVALLKTRPHELLVQQPIFHVLHVVVPITAFLFQHRPLTAEVEPTHLRHCVAHFV
ncbi:hypothetical protein D3C73_1604440 [compost metagenome]